MNAAEQVALVWRALLHTARVSLRPALWAPWSVLLAVQAAALAAFANPAHPAVSAWLGAFLERTAGEGVLHYPEYFRQLPWIWGRADLAIAALVAPVVTGWSCAAFAEAFSGRRPSAGGAWRAAAPRARTLVLAWLPLQLATFAFALLLGGWVEGQRHTFVSRLLGQLLVVGGPLVAQTVFFYTPCYVALGRLGAVESWWALPRATGRAGFGAFLASAAALVAVNAFVRVVAIPAAGWERLAPERSVVRLFAADACSAAIGFALAGVATLVYLSALSPEAPERQP